MALRRQHGPIWQCFFIGMKKKKELSHVLSCIKDIMVYDVYRLVVWAAL